jgi:hypothetical protein
VTTVVTVAILPRCSLNNFSPATPQRDRPKSPNPKISHTPSCSEPAEPPICTIPDFCRSFTSDFNPFLSSLTTSRPCPLATILPLRTNTQPNHHAGDYRSSACSTLCKFCSMQTLRRTNSVQPRSALFPVHLYFVRLHLLLFQLTPIYHHGLFVT